MWCCADRRTLGRKLAEVSFRASEPRLRLGTFDNYAFPQFPAWGIGAVLRLVRTLLLAGVPKAGFGWYSILRREDSRCSAPYCIVRDLGIGGLLDETIISFRSDLGGGFISTGRA